LVYDAIFLIYHRFGRLSSPNCDSIFS